MTAIDLMASAQSLPTQEKLLLIQAITQMLCDDFTRAATKHDAQTTIASVQPIAISMLENSVHIIRANIRELLSRPDPPPDQMLKAGMFAGKLPDLSDEDFQIGEWRPTNEDLEDA